jgi:hypothetical protein
MTGSKKSIYGFGYNFESDLLQALKQCKRQIEEVENNGFYFEIRDVKAGTGHVLVEVRKLQSEDLPKKAKRKQDDQSLSLAQDEGLTTCSWFIFDLESNLCGCLGYHVAGPGRLKQFFDQCKLKIDFEGFIKPEAWKRAKERQHQISELEMKITTLGASLTGSAWDASLFDSAKKIGAHSATVIYRTAPGAGKGMLEKLKELANSGVAQKAKISFTGDEKIEPIDLLADQLKYPFTTDKSSRTLGRSDAYDHLKRALQEFRKTIA